MNEEKNFLISLKEKLSQYNYEDLEKILLAQAKENFELMDECEENNGN